MSFLNAVLLYLLLFRIAIVAAGVFCVYLGYRLFCRGVGIASGAEGSTIESAIVGAQLTLKNAAPGTAFALFGAIVIAIMLIQTSPSVTWETMSKWRPGTQATTAEGQGATTEAQNQGENEQSSKMVLRGGEGETIASVTALGREYERNGDTANAERQYAKAVSMMAEPMNDLAWRYYEDKRAKDAVGLATLAVQLQPNEPRYKDTLDQVKAAAK